MSQRLGQEWAFSVGFTLSTDKCCSSAGFCHRLASLPTYMGQSRLGFAAVTNDPQISVTCNSTHLSLALATYSSWAGYHLVTRNLYPEVQADSAASFWNVAAHHSKWKRAQGAP